MSEKKSIYKSLADAVQQKVEAREVQTLPDIPAIVKRIRLAKKLSGVEVCRRARDLDPRTLTALEKGRIRNPTLKTLHSLARGLGVNTEELLRSGEETPEHHFCSGNQKGAFVLDFPKKGLKIVSFTPLIHDFFCGKLILSPKVKISDQVLNHPFPVYLSVLVGALEVETEDYGKAQMREGDNLFFRGNVKHSFLNMLHRETAVLFLTAPSFVK